MNLESEIFEGFEPQLKEDFLDEDVRSLFDLVESHTPGLKSTAVDDFKFEEIIRQKLKISTCFEQNWISDKEQVRFEEEISELKNNLNNEANLSNSNHSIWMYGEGLSLFDEKDLSSIDENKSNWFKML